jgi:hypothetical protein
VAPAPGFPLSSIARKIAEGPLQAASSRVILFAQAVRLLAGTEAELLSDLVELSPLGVIFRFKAGQDPGFPLEVRTPEHDSKRNAVLDRVAGLLQAQAALVTLIVHVPDEQDGIHFEQGPHDMKRRPRHERARCTRLAVEVTHRTTKAWDLLRVGRQLMNVEKRSRISVVRPFADALGVRCHDIGDPLRTLKAQHAIDEPGDRSKVRFCLAEEDEPHEAFSLSTQSFSASRLHSWPAESEPLSFSASGCSARHFTATVPSSRSAKACMSAGSTSSRT